MVAVEDASLNVHPGAVTCLLGDNGAGKSTLIGALLGVLRAHRGRIRVLGFDLPADAMEVRARAGVMAEQAGSGTAD